MPSKTIQMPGMNLRGIVNKVQVINADGSIDCEYGEFSNLILDQGLDEAANYGFAELFENCVIGTGNSTPIESQVELDNEHGRTNNYLTGRPNCGTFITDEGVAPAIWSNRRTFDFPMGSLNSNVDGNYQELGFSWSSSAGQNLYARTLIKDENGNPVSISVTDEQILRVQYTQEIGVSPVDGGSEPVGIPASFEIENIGTINGVHQIECAYGQIDDRILIDGVRWIDKRYSNRYSAGIFSYIDNSGSTLLNPPERLDRLNSLEPVTNNVNLILSDSIDSIKPVFVDFNSTAAHLNDNERVIVRCVNQLYTNGAFSRDKIALFSSEKSIGLVSSIYIREDVSNISSYRFLINEADRFGIVDTHELSITLRFSWGRA